MSLTLFLSLLRCVLTIQWQLVVQEECKVLPSLDLFIKIPKDGEWMCVGLGVFVVDVTFVELHKACNIHHFHMYHTILFLL